MFLPRSDVFKDLRQEAINDISEIAVEENHEKGTMLFSAGDAAEHFYILVDGRVELIIGETAMSHYSVSKIGEWFGWSSVVGRSSYTARAECREPTTVMKIHRASLDKVFDAHARSGRMFYRRLAEAMGERWLELHRTFMSEMTPRQAVSYGTGQIMETGQE